MIQSAIIKEIDDNAIICDIAIRGELRTVNFTKKFSWDPTHFESDLQVWIKISENTFYYENKTRLTKLFLWKQKEYYLVKSYVVRKQRVRPIDWQDGRLAEFWKQNSIYESTVQPNYDDLIELSFPGKH